MKQTTSKNPVARKRTQKQQEAARRNGAKSKGPVTEAGKQKSSENAFQTGIYSTKLLTTRIENSDRFKDLLRDFNLEWQPNGPTEATLVRSLATESVLLDRWRALEAAALDSMLDRTSLDDKELFRTPPDPHEWQFAGLEHFHENDHLPTIPVIERAIARADRTFRASLASLLQLRKSGQPARPGPTPPGEPSESLERRIAEHKRMEEAEARARAESANPRPPVTNPRPPGSGSGNFETNPTSTQPSKNQKVAEITEARPSLFPGFTADVFRPTPVSNPLPPAHQTWKKEPAA